MADSRIDDLRRRLERDPASRLFAQLAEELRKAGELEEAIGVARRGLERHPAYPSARLTLGRALLDSGDAAAARLELDAAVQGAPENILASRLLGEALETLGDLGSALEQYRRTLQMAPGDAHAQSRIRAIQKQLGAPVDSAGGKAEVTEPLQTFGADEEEEEEALPPTIRIRMPGDPPRPVRAPRPPRPSPQAAGEVTGSSQPPPEEAVSPVPTDAEVVGSELPGTLPMPGEDAGEPPEPRGEPAGQGADTSVAESTRMQTPGDDARAVGTAPPVDAMAAEGPDGATGSGTEGDPAQGAASDLAPTSPKSRAAEYAEADSDVPPPPAPPVMRRADEGGETAGGGGDETGGVAAAKGAGGPEDQTGAEPVGDAESPPLSSATLAELYFEQGLLERAVEVYRQVLEEDPSHARARDRLAQIERLVREGAADLPVSPAPTAEDPAARRRALERTIERLEALLEVVRRR